jgi:hypothetical protein
VDALAARLYLGRWRSLLATIKPDHHPRNRMAGLSRNPRRMDGEDERSNGSEGMISAKDLDDLMKAMTETDEGMRLLSLGQIIDQINRQTQLIQWLHERVKVLEESNG